MRECKILSIIGASGLVGSSIVKEALLRGYKVNGTLRGDSNSQKIKYLKNLPNAENLELYSSEMQKKETLLKPLENADAVLIPQVVLDVIHMSVTVTLAHHMLCHLVFVQDRLLVGPPGAFALLLSLIMEHAVVRA